MESLQLCHVIFGLDSMWKKLALVCGFVGFIIGTTKLLMEWLDFGIALPTSIGAFFGLLLIALSVDAWIITLVHPHRPLHVRLVERFRRWINVTFEAIIIKLWHTHIEVNSRGNATVRTEIKGKVNFELNRWITCTIHTSQPQKLMSEGFKIVVYDHINERRFSPDPIIDEPTYKMFRIRFQDVLRRGQNFHYTFEYKLKHSFLLDRPDFWYHIARRQEEKVVLSLVPPVRYKVKDTYYGETITEFGDDTGGRNPNNQPQLVDERCLRWEINEVMHGTKHKLCWELEKA